MSSVSFWCLGSLFAGFGLYRTTTCLLVLLAGFIPLALLAAFQVKATPITDALILIGAYIATAAVSAIVGTLGHLWLIPGSEALMRYGRAKAFFNDQRVLTGGHFS